MNNNKCPCYGCNDRCDVCHSICEKYIEWKKENDARREAEAKERALKRDYYDFKEKAIKKVRKNKND